MIATQTSPDAGAPAAPLHASAPERATKLLLATIVMIPLAVGWVVWFAPGAADDFNRRVTLAPFDIALSALMVVWLREIAPQARNYRRPRASVGLVIACAFVAVFAISLALHPSTRGFEYAVRLAGCVALVDVIRRLSTRGLRAMCVTLTVCGVAESVLAIAQVVAGHGFALYPIDHAGPLFAFGDTHAGRGGLSHPYHLTVFLLLAAFAALVAGCADRPFNRRLWMGALALIGAGLAVTFSRAMLLALIPAVLVWCLSRRDHGATTMRRLVGALLFGLAATTILFSSGWSTRAQQSSGSGADRGRITLARHGLELAAEHPLTGVGPARYVLALAEPGAPDGELLPSHNLLVQAAAELGVLGACVVAAACLWYAKRIARRGMLVLGGAWLLVPFLMLDSYAYVFPTGIALSAIWLGLLEHPQLRAGTFFGNLTTVEVVQ